MERVNANRWGTGIYVYPAATSRNADGIQRLELRREGRVIQPLTATVGPITTIAADGSKKQLTRGYFAFPPDAFAPSADLTLVLVGASGETSCVLDSSRLKAIR
jgi:hypothetical protein